MCLPKQLCPHEVPLAIECADLLSFIDARDGAMPQDIHLDSFAPGWSFLTAQEHDQELLILCNGFEMVTIINSISGDRKAAADYVRDKMRRNGTTWSDEEWAETVEPRVWQWLCLQAVEKKLGAVPPLQVRRVTVPKGWTIVVDSCTPHAGAPAGRGFGPGGFRVHVYAVAKAMDRVIPGFEAAQEHTIDILYHENPYFPIMCWAQRQHSGPFGPPAPQ